MMWSEQELCNLALGGAKIASERVIRHLDEEQNGDIFLKENFSFLWGALGAGGVAEASLEAKKKIWQALLENGAADAYDKGILGDFNKELIACYKDERLRAWRGLDNYQAALKFRKEILNELLKSDEKLENEVLNYCLNDKRIIERLFKNELDEKIKRFLEAQYRHKDLGESGRYDYLEAAGTLAGVTACLRRKLHFEEQKYLFSYFFNALADGIAPEDIGFGDQVLAKLVAFLPEGGESELENEPVREHNLRVAECAREREAQFGFFDETAANLALSDHSLARELAERCLKMAENNNARGVVFALALLSLNQVKSAAKILLALAKRGKATEMCSFLFRLLGQSKGAETMILGIIRTNLKALPDLGDGYKDYVARRHLTAVEAFIEAGRPKEAAQLLSELVAMSYLKAGEDYVLTVSGLINRAAAMDKSLCDELIQTAKVLNLNVYQSQQGVVTGLPEDNPLTAARRRLEQAVNSATTLDLSKVSEKMTGFESSTYEAYQNFKDKMSGRKNQPQERAAKNGFAKKDEGVFLEKKTAAVGNFSKEDKAAADAVLGAGGIDDLLVEAASELEPGAAFIGSWDDDEAKTEPALGRAGGIAGISSSEIDRHYEALRRDAAAKERFNESRHRGAEADVDNPLSVQRIRGLAKKVRFFKKK